MYNICLNMIVRNEEENILKTLNNIIDKIKIDYWVICDTGSTDNTKDIIINFFKDTNINGELYDDKWIDFAFNRNLAIERAEGKSKYLFFFDADDLIYGDLNIPIDLDYDCYHFLYGDEFHWNRINLVSTKYKWRYKGILHETIYNLTTSVYTKCILNKNYYIQGNCNGYRSKNKNKYYLDALLLEREIILNNEKDMISRYIFYCAQSYKDANCIDKAIEYYKKVLDNDNWNQEKYYSALMLGSLFLKKNMKDIAIHYYFLTNKYDKTRIEGLYMCYELLKNSMTIEFQLKLLTMVSIEDYPDPYDNKYLFIDSKIHNIYFLNLVIQLSYKLEKYDLGIKYLFRQLKNIINKEHIIINLENILLFKKKTNIDTNLLNNILKNKINNLKILSLYNISIDRDIDIDMIISFLKR
jgi:hypothetical protein